MSASLLAGASDCLLLGAVLLIASPALARAAVHDPDANGGPNEAAAESDRETPRVRAILESTADASEILPLLRAELTALGVDVVEAASSAMGSNAGESATAVFEHDPRVCCRIVVKFDSVAVWIFEPNSRRVILHEVFARSDGSAVEQRTAVLHAVEFLRWSLRESERRSAQEEQALKAAQLAPSAPTSAPKAWFAGLTPLLLYSPGGTSPGVGAALDICFRHEHAAMRLLGASLLLPNQLSGPEGVIEAVPRWVALEGWWLQLRPRTGFSTGVGGGVSVVSTELRATAEPGLTAHRDSVLTVAPLAELGGEYVFDDSFSIGLQVAGLLPLRAARLHIDERRIGQFGRVLLTAGLGLRVALR